MKTSHLLIGAGVLFIGVPVLLSVVGFSMVAKRRKQFAAESEADYRRFNRQSRRNEIEHERRINQMWNEAKNAHQALPPFAAPREDFNQSLKRDLDRLNPTLATKGKPSDFNFKG